MCLYMYIHLYLHHVYGCTSELDDSVMRVKLAVRITACDKRIIDRVSFNTIKGDTCISKFNLPRERIKEPSSFGIRKSNSHSRH